MSFANWNLLDEALTLIPPTKVQYRRWVKNSTNEVGMMSATYTEWTDAYGIVQPNGESNEHTEGIDFSKSRVVIWLRGVELTGTGAVSHSSPDQILFYGKVYNVVTVDNWLPYDNYRRCECVLAANLGPNTDFLPGTQTEGEIGSTASDAGQETSDAQGEEDASQGGGEETAENEGLETPSSTAPIQPNIKIRF